MNPKRLIQTVSTLVFVMMAVCLYFFFASPFLEFASHGNGDLPTQIGVLIIRMLAFGAVFGILGMGIYFTYRFELLSIVGTLFPGMYCLFLGVGIRYHSGVIFLLIAMPVFLAFGFFLKRFKPTLLALQNKYRIAAPNAGGTAAPPRASA